MLDIHKPVSSSRTKPARQKHPSFIVGRMNSGGTPDLSEIKFLFWQVISGILPLTCFSPCPGHCRDFKYLSFCLASILLLIYFMKLRPMYFALPLAVTFMGCTVLTAGFLSSVG